MLYHSTANIHKVNIHNSTKDYVLTLRPNYILAVTLVSVSALIVIGSCASYARYNSEHEWVRLVSTIFRLDSEKNMPTLFSFGLLLFCSFLLAVIFLQQSQSGAKRRAHWGFLVGLFFLMSFDEAAGVHEQSATRIREALDAGGWFFFAWVIPAWIFVAIFVVAYLRFLAALPRPITGLFVLSGGLYVGGALGVEMPAGAYVEAHGFKSFRYEVFTIVEEALELTGLAVFAYALARFLARQREPFRFRLQTR